MPIESEPEGKTFPTKRARLFIMDIMEILPILFINLIQWIVVLGLIGVIVRLALIITNVKS